MLVPVPRALVSLIAVFAAVSLACTEGGDGSTTLGSTGGETTGTPTSTTESSSGSGTGGAMFCSGWKDSPAPAYLDLYNRMNEPLTKGATLPLECGGQGLFMFGLYPKFGGFEPAGDHLGFEIIVDVAGFNNNPEGHFYNGTSGYYVGCESFEGGLGGVLPVIPLDNLADLSELDGKPAMVHVVMHVPGGDVTVDIEVVLAAVKDESWAFCGG